MAIDWKCTPASPFFPSRGTKDSSGTAGCTRGCRWWCNSWVSSHRLSISPCPLVQRSVTQFLQYITMSMCLLETNRLIARVSPGELEVGSAPFVEEDQHRGTLHIRGVQEVDAGQYSCVASSSAGTSSGTVSLVVGGETAFHFSTQDLFFSLNLHKRKRKLHPSFHSGAIVFRGSGWRDSQRRGEHHPPLHCPGFPAADRDLAQTGWQTDFYADRQPQ